MVGFQGNGFQAPPKIFEGAAHSKLRPFARLSPVAGWLQAGRLSVAGRGNEGVKKPGGSRCHYPAAGLFLGR